VKEREVESLAKCLSCDYEDAATHGDEDILAYWARQHVETTGHRVIIQMQVKGSKEGRIAVGRMI